MASAAALHRQDRPIATPSRQRFTLAHPPELNMWVTVAPAVRPPNSSACAKLSSKEMEVAVPALISALSLHDSDRSAALIFPCELTLKPSISGPPLQRLVGVPFRRLRPYCGSQASIDRLRNALFAAMRKSAAMSLAAASLHESPARSEGSAWGMPLPAMADDEHQNHNALEGKATLMNDVTFMDEMPATVDESSQTQSPLTEAKLSTIKPIAQGGHNPINDDREASDTDSIPTPPRRRRILRERISSAKEPNMVVKRDRSRSPRHATVVKEPAGSKVELLTEQNGALVEKWLFAAAVRQAFGRQSSMLIKSLVDNLLASDLWGPSDGQKVWQRRRKVSEGLKQLEAEAKIFLADDLVFSLS
eukprot:gnl/TRDRNA2_/TRDRNA2_44022_c0_seq1.p1 gnl/TRDRNA2_/TRDRNA2_44022_c0~~gnl/TRDRNA2_/TRDRNA2_44022_c0_seq1.p1  ORF type:complete len:380 (+),score=57.60 gnl/TRDRNA2_/TRDRNA2_44022_c0_seq1:57-1142(+)